MAFLAEAVAGANTVTDRPEYNMAIITENRLIGRPNIYVTPTGEEIFLPVHEAFMASRAKRQMAVFNRRGRKTSKSLEKMMQYLWANPRSVGKTLAPIRKQAKEIIWDDPDMLFHPNVLNPQIVRSVNKSDLRIVLRNGSTWSLDGMDNPHSKRGGNVKVLHLTEAGDHQESTWTEIYETVLIAHGGVAIFEGNPRGKNWYYRLFINAPFRPGWETFFLSAKDGPFFTPEELADLAANTPDAVFRAEYLCEWIDSLGTVFRDYERLMVLDPSKPLRKRRYRLGIDLGKLQDYTVLTMVDRHTWDEVEIRRFNHLSWEVQKKEIIKFAKEFSAKDNENSLDILIESNGIGEPIYDSLALWSLSDDAKKYNVMVDAFKTTNLSKGMVVNNLSMLIDQGEARFIKDPIVNKEMGLFTYKKTPLNFIYGAPDKEHDDTVMSKCLAYWNLGGKFPLPQLEPPPPKTRFGIPESQWNQGQRKPHPFLGMG